MSGWMVRELYLEWNGCGLKWSGMDVEWCKDVIVVKWSERNEMVIRKSVWVCGWLKWKGLIENEGNGGKEGNGRVDSSMCSFHILNRCCAFLYHWDGIAEGRSVKSPITFPSPNPSIMDCRWWLEEDSTFISSTLRINPIHSISIEWTSTHPIQPIHLQMEQASRTIQNNPTLRLITHPHYLFHFHYSNHELCV